MVNTKQIKSAMYFFGQYYLMLEFDVFLPFQSWRERERPEPVGCLPRPGQGPGGAGHAHQAGDAPLAPRPGGVQGQEHKSFLAQVENNLTRVVNVEEQQIYFLNFTLKFF